MTKQIKNIITYTSLTIGFIFVLWFAYNSHFKFVINDYQATQIEKRLQENFHNNRDNFNDILSFSRQLGTLENLEFRKQGQIYFQIYDTLQDRYQENSDFNFDFIRIGYNLPFEVSEIHFLDSNAIKVVSGDHSFISNRWIIDYVGDINNPLVKNLLSYNKIRVTQLKQLKEKLDKINCSGFHKDDRIISIRYMGHWGENFEYLIPLTEINDRQNWNKLAENIYWVHNQPGCGWTDW